MAALREFEDKSTRTYELADDIQEGLRWMKDVELSELSSLLTHFDPITWQA